MCSENITKQNTTLLKSGTSMYCQRIVRIFSSSGNHEQRMVVSCMAKEQAGKRLRKQLCCCLLRLQQHPSSSVQELEQMILFLRHSMAVFTIRVALYYGQSSGQI